MIDRIIQTVSDTLKTEVTIQTSQKNCVKWDSLNHVHLIVALEEAFDITFEPDEITQMTDIRRIEQTINKKIL